MPTFRLTIPGKKTCGCPTDQIMIVNFKCVYDWLENEADSELYTLVKSEIYCKMEVLAEKTS